MEQKVLCEHEWVESDELFAITRIEKNKDKINFLPSVGIPVVVELCTNCGEMRLFSAKYRGKL